MKKNECKIVRFLFQMLFLFIASEMMGQNASKEINEIKRNEAYLFEEATAATAKEARDLAVVKLSKILADYMKENNPQGAEKLDDFKDLAEGAEEIVTDRGSQKRVFLYYSKHDIDATAEEAAQTNTSPKPPIQKTEEKAPTEPMAVSPTLTDQTSVSNTEPLVQQQEVVKQTTELPTSRTNSNKSVSDESLAEWQKRLINTFLSEGLTLLSAKDMVNTYRIENKIKRYGSKSNPPNQAGQAFYVFADETDRVIAVLGRDNGGRRMNYVSGNYENISDYNSQNYIWFILNN